MMKVRLLPKLLAVLALLALTLVGASQATRTAEAAPPCPPCTIDPPDRPDLRVGARSAEPNGGQWAVSFTATNGGTKGAGSFQAVVKDGAATVYSVQVGALATGQSRTYSFAYPKTGCSVTLQVVLDPTHAVTESNESNNGATISRDTCPPPPGPAEDTAIWRAQVRMVVGDVDDAGTDDGVKVELNDNHHTWLDYGRDDFQRNSDFTYDLVLSNVGKLDDIKYLRISKTGSDGLCLKSFDLLINGKKIFSQNLAVGRTPCRWIDGDDGHQPTFSVSRAALRAHPLWQTYTQPFPPLVIPRAELESRIESIVGDRLHGTKLYWGEISGRAVEVTRKDDHTVHVDLDLAYDLDNWFDPEVDVDLDMGLACANGKIALTASNVTVHVDANWVTDVLSLGLVNIAEHYIDGRIQDALQTFTYKTEVGVPFCPTISVQPNGDVVFGLP